ncbi:DUF1648 domain-containing protein [Microtetraspora malaysiensis]|uniref:DUF1648 domain-containing protein n=1 Tax=Microtetraspora malaysiensis TaxID=161358 RepID=UPI003D8C040F
MNDSSVRDAAFRRRFLLVAGAWAVLVAAVLVAVPLMFESRLPDPLATHWGPSGEPNGSMPFAVFALTALLWVLVAGVVLGAAAAGRVALRRAARRRLTALLGWIGALLIGLQATTITANLDRRRWEDAASLGWQAVVVIVAAFAVGGLGWLAGRPGPDERPVAAGSAPEAFVLNQGSGPCGSPPRPLPWSRAWPSRPSPPPCRSPSARSSASRPSCGSGRRCSRSPGWPVSGSPRSG